MQSIDPEVCNQDFNKEKEGMRTEPRRVDAM